VQNAVSHTWSCMAPLFV